MSARSAGSSRPSSSSSSGLTSAVLPANVEVAAYGDQPGPAGFRGAPATTARQPRRASRGSGARQDRGRRSRTDREGTWGGARRRRNVRVSSLRLQWANSTGSLDPRGLSSLFHCVRLLSLPAPRWPALFSFHSVEVLFCPAGARPLGAGSPPLARGADSDPPARATEQGRPAAGPLAVRMKPRQRHPTAGRPLGDPHAPAPWLLSPAGRISPPPSRSPRDPAWRRPRRASVFGWGFESAGAAGGRSLRSPRAPDARAALGRRRRGLMRTPRGPGADRALRSRAEECAAAAAGETQGRTRPPRHRQNKSLTQ